VVPHLRRLVEQEAIACRGNDLLEAAVGVSGVQDKFVQCVHVGTMMLAVMIVEGLGGDVRLQGFSGVRQIRELVLHGQLPQ
jgi:hypothetical protein